MNKKITALFPGPLAWDEAVRAALCMLPMAVAPLFGFSALVVSLGQAGFFYASQPLPKYQLTRILAAILILGMGLSFYLLGGTIATNPWVAVILTFFMGVVLMLLSGWNMLALLGFSFVSIFSAGLNASSPEQVAENFLAFALALGWGSLVSLLPFFKGTLFPQSKVRPMSQLLDGALRMGMGMAIALGISEMFSFSKFGWAPSAVGNIVRFDHDEEKKRAWVRLFATIVGVFITVVVFFFTTDPLVLIWLAVIFAITNGLLKNTIIGKTPLLYTATLLMLYSMNDPSAATELQIQRILYNLVGIVIAMLVIWFPFPYASKRIAKSLEQMGVE